MSGDRKVTSIKALIESITLKLVQPFVTSTTIVNNPLETHITNIPLDTRPNPLEVTPSSTTTDVSNVSVTLLAANADRKSFVVQNISNSQDPVYINCKTPATVGTGIALIAGESYTFPSEFSYTGIITAISTTTTTKTIIATEVT